MLHSVCSWLTSTAMLGYFKVLCCLQLAEARSQVEDLEEQLTLRQESVDFEKAAVIETEKAKKRWQVLFSWRCCVFSNACVMPAILNQKRQERLAIQLTRSIWKRPFPELGAIFFFYVIYKTSLLVIVKHFMFSCCFRAKCCSKKLDFGKADMVKTGKVKKRW